MVFLIDARLKQAECYLVPMELDTSHEKDPCITLTVHLGCCLKLLGMFY